MTTLQDLLHNTTTLDNPIEALRRFLETEQQRESAKQIGQMRFVGYVLELGYDSAKIITSDPYKLAVGGIPRGSFLIMTPISARSAAPHFTLLRVTGVSPTPLSNQVQQTYFELHKKSMPELDVWTQSELQWGALDCDVLGMFYANPERAKSLAFSGDVNNVVSAHRYKVFAPDEALLHVIVNGTVETGMRLAIGNLRTMECQLASAGSVTGIEVAISMQDFMGCRTAMFGKTRLGKSNVIKLIAKGMLEVTADSRRVGQLIFDINGEYANDNPQDDNKSLRSAYETRCIVYALTKRSATPSRSLRLNFYEQPDSCIGVIASLLQQDSRASIYIKNFAAVTLPAIDVVTTLPFEERTRPIRKIQMYWAILKKAGFLEDTKRLRGLGLRGPVASGFNPGFAQTLRVAAYAQQPVPDPPDTLDQLVSELDVIATFAQENPKDKSLKSTGSGETIFDAQDLALLRFLAPTGGAAAGPAMLGPYAKQYHDPNASNFIQEILELLDKGQTVILDLGNATDALRRYFADMLSQAVFGAQEQKFVNNQLGDRFVQLYFEEAHNLFPPESKDLTGVYARFAKEGAKFHIGMVYSTQSPSTINAELLAQTENFFIGHLSSQDETRALSRVQVAFDGIEEDILRAKTPGYMRMLTRSHRFVIPLQAFRFGAAAAQLLDH